MSAKCGIYCFTNTVNHKRYVGRSVDVIDRRCRHIRELNDKMHPNPHWQASWNKYGPAAFTFEILQICDRDSLVVWERHWMNFFDTQNPRKGYNKVDAAGGILGQKQSPEHVEKRIATLRGRSISHTHRERISKSLQGHGFSAETLSKMSVAKLGDKNPNKREDLRKRKSITSSKLWEIVDPTGLVHIVRNLTQFCIENGLSVKSMRNVAEGHRASCYGWKVNHYTPLERGITNGKECR